MDKLFFEVANMSITAVWIILAVVLIRVIFRNAPKYIRCILWALVAFRLICPFSIESAISLVPDTEPVTVVSERYINQSNTSEFILNSFDESENTTDDSVQSEHMSSGSSSQKEYVSTDYGDDKRDTVSNVDERSGWEFIIVTLPYVWIIGAFVLLIYSFVSYMGLKNRVRASLQLCDNIYLCDGISSPFIMGVFKPCIYLPSGIKTSELEHVIAHEKAHLKRMDNWWKVMGFIILTIHWFNPFVWVSYILFCRDIELACDEHVIKNMSVDEKKAYSDALLSYSMPHKNVIAYPLAFGEVGVKKRIKSVLHYKKPAVWIIVAAVLVCLVVGICFLTNPKSDSKNTDSDIYAIGKTGTVKLAEFSEAYQDVLHSGYDSEQAEKMAKEYCFSTEALYQEALREGCEASEEEVEAALESFEGANLESDPTITLPDDYDTKAYWERIRQKNKKEITINNYLIKLQSVWKEKYSKEYKMFSDYAEYIADQLVAEEDFEIVNEYLLCEKNYFKIDKVVCVNLASSALYTETDYPGYMIDSGKLYINYNGNEPQWLCAGTLWEYVLNEDTFDVPINDGPMWAYEEDGETGFASNVSEKAVLAEGLRENNREAWLVSGDHGSYIVMEQDNGIVYIGHCTIDDDGHISMFWCLFRVGEVSVDKNVENQMVESEEDSFKKDGYYRIVKEIYSQPATSFRASETQYPVYLMENGILYYCDDYLNNQEWMSLGITKKIELTEENFDDIITFDAIHLNLSDELDDEVLGYLDSEEAFRKANKNAWLITGNNGEYLLLEQEDGSIFIASIYVANGDISAYLTIVLIEETVLSLDSGNVIWDDDVVKYDETIQYNQNTGIVTYTTISQKIFNTGDEALYIEPRKIDDKYYGISIHLEDEDGNIITNEYQVPANREPLEQAPSVEIRCTNEESYEVINNYEVYENNWLSDEGERTPDLFQSLELTKGEISLFEVPSWKVFQAGTFTLTFPEGLSPDLVDVEDMVLNEDGGIKYEGQPCEVVFRGATVNRKDDEVTFFLADHSSIEFYEDWISYADIAKPFYRGYKVRCYWATTEGLQSITYMFVIRTKNIEYESMLN